MVPQGSRIQSIISIAGNQVIRNLSEPSEFTMMRLDTYADYLRKVEPRIESRAVRALLTTGGPRIKTLHGRYVEVYGPCQVMLNVDGISIYSRTYVTTDMKPKKYSFSESRNMQGGASHKVRHDTNLETTWTNVEHEIELEESAVPQWEG